MFEQSKQRDRPEKALPIQRIDTCAVSWEEVQKAGQQADEKMRIGQEMNQILVAGWDEEDLGLEPLQAEATTSVSRKASDPDFTPDRSRAIQLALHWSNRTHAERVEQYLGEGSRK